MQNGYTNLLIHLRNFLQELEQYTMKTPYIFSMRVIKENFINMQI